jgi:hypothetical protein
MKPHQLIIAASTICLSVLASRAGAAIIVTDGTLHVYGGGGALDQPFVPPETSASAHAGMGWEGINNNSFAVETVGFEDGRVRISTHLLGASGYASASGSLSFTEDEPETVWVRMTFYPVGGPLYDPTYHHQGGVTLYEVGGGNVFLFSLQIRPGPFEFLGPLSPGQYTLNWWDGGINNSYYDAGLNLTMSVPEPSGLLLLAPGALPFVRRGRQQS